jgi:hypothetical protein
MYKIIINIAILNIIYRLAVSSNATFLRLVSSESETFSVDSEQLSNFHLKTETEASFRKVVF